MTALSINSRIIGEASDNIKLKAGSIIEISRLQGFKLQTTGKNYYPRIYCKNTAPNRSILFILLQSGVRLSTQFRVKYYAGHL